MSLLSADEVCNAALRVGSIPMIAGTTLPIEATCTLPVGHGGAHCDEVLGEWWPR